MLVYGSDPGWVWSDLNGLAPFVSGLVWFKLYWAAWALLFVLLRACSGCAGASSGRAGASRSRGSGCGAGQLRAAAAALTLIVGLGGSCLQHEGPQRLPRRPTRIAEGKAEYERRYKRFEDAPSPSVYAMRMRVELYPADGAAEVEGTYRLVNREDRAIDSLHVLPSALVDTRALRFDRGVRLVVDDSRLRYRVYALERPLAPGDSIAMRFRLVQRPRGFRNAGAPTDVTSERHVPLRHLDAGPRATRRPGADRRDEAPRARPPPPQGGAERGETWRRERGEAGAAGDERDDRRHRPAPHGHLARAARPRVDGERRRYFHYRTDRPTRFGSAVLSAAYAVRRDTARGVALSVHYHPTHDVNVDRMLRSMRASLAYYGEQFGPYQFDELRVVEFPLYAPGARAHPHTIAFSEGSAFLTRVDSGAVDRTFFVVAHETAHQWWGGQVIPRRSPAPGSSPRRSRSTAR
jgi:hypothetical protein